MRAEEAIAEECLECPAKEHAERLTKVPLFEQGAIGEPSVAKCYDLAARRRAEPSGSVSRAQTCARREAKSRTVRVCSESAMKDMKKGPAVNRRTFIKSFKPVRGIQPLHSRPCEDQA